MTNGELKQYYSDWVNNPKVDAEDIENEICKLTGSGSSELASGMVADFNAAVLGQDVKDDIVKLAILQLAYNAKINDAAAELAELSKVVTISGGDVIFDGDVKVGGTRPVFRYMRTLTDDDSLDSDDLSTMGVYLRRGDITSGSTLYNSEPTHTGYVLIVFANPGVSGDKRIAQLIINRNSTMISRAKLFGEYSEWSTAAKKDYIDNLLTKYNCNFVADHSSRNESSTTENGITYSISHGVVTLSGTATGRVLIQLEGSSSKIPTWIQDGRYYANVKKSATDNIRYQIAAYSSGQYITSFCNVPDAAYFNVSGAGSITGAVCRLVIDEGETVDNTVEVEILTAIPNINVVSAMKDAPVKIRLMQYNCGKFNRGQSLSGDYHFLTTDNYQTVLNNYKAMLGEYQPDIIGMQEAEDEVTVKGVNGGSDYDVSLDDVLFDKLYPWSYMQQNVISARAIKSKYKILSANRKNLNYSYIWDGETVSSNFWVVYAHIQVENKKIAVVSNAFPNSNDSYSEERNLLMKKAHFQAVADLLEGEEYAFIICDANAGPESMLHIMYDTGGMAGRGYDFVNGSYFPWAETFESQTDQHRTYVDQILYKDNGKIKLSSFMTRWAYRDTLASDHIPIFADFILM